MHSSVESTSPFSHQDSGEHSADTLQAAAHNGEPPGKIHTNDISSDTPHSQLEQNNAPSASSSGSSDSSLTSEAKSQDSGRELDLSNDAVNLREEGVIRSTFDSLEEGVPGETPNYESKEGERENERAIGELHERGSSVDEAKIITEKETNDDERVQQPSGQEPVAEHSRGESANDGNVGEAEELVQEAGVTGQAIPEGGEGTRNVEGGINIHEESKEDRETSELFDRLDDRKIAESANQEESKDNLGQDVDTVSSSREESGGAPPLRGEEGRETGRDDGRREESKPERREGEGEGARGEVGLSAQEEEREREAEESSDDDMMTFEEFKQKKREEGTCNLWRFYRE